MTFAFLPTNLVELRQKGWESVDIVLVHGDAYVDHPSFGAALIGRYLEAKGFKVGIISQPDWRSDGDFLACGKPNLFFAVSGGNLDSMIANYNSEKKPRKHDMYTPGDVAGRRPDRATIVYANILKRLFPQVPIVLGGIEASLRRIVYYDYWSNKLRRSLLFDARADLLLYGMSERAMVEVAERLRNQATLLSIPNSAYISAEKPAGDVLELPSYEELLADKILYAKTVLMHEQECAKKERRIIVQKCQNKYLVVEPPAPPDQAEFEKLFELPFTREPHPSYREPIPAYTFVKDSVLAHRGCYGGCSFCTLTLHQGKYIISRSEESILKEIREVISRQKDFKGNILDVGGPSADMYGSYCASAKGCARLSCLYPEICKNLKSGHQRQINLLRQIRKLPGIKKVFINSGIRSDLALTCPEYIQELAEHHVSGQLSMAPEHIAPQVLRLMQKPPFSVYERFQEIFKSMNIKFKLRQFIVPYLISSHPGCTLQDMYDLAVYLKKNHLKVEQVQNFIPIPMTLSAAMYYSEYDPFANQKIHVAKAEERAMQRALLQPQLSNNRLFVRTALKRLGKLNEFERMVRN